MKGGKNGDDLQAGSLNPLLSEAVFSMMEYIACLKELW